MPFVPLWRMVQLRFDRGFQADSLVYLFAYAAIETQDLSSIFTWLVASGMSPPSLLVVAW